MPINLGSSLLIVVTKFVLQSTVMRVKKNVSWFVKTEEHKISFEDFGKRRMKPTEEEKTKEIKFISHC